MNGLSGLGAYPPGPPDDPCKYDPNWEACMQTYNASRATQPTNQTSSSWNWQGFATTMGQGLVHEILHRNDAPPAPPVPQTPPYAGGGAGNSGAWYTTPMGMGGIAAGALVLFLLLK